MEKFKQDSFQNFGGINQKVSRYMTGEREALVLENFDFTTPGAWTKAPGSTFYSGATVAGRITGLYEFERLSGFSQVIFTANTNAYFFAGAVPTPFRSGLTSGAIFDFVTFTDLLFATNGVDAFKWDGTIATNFSCPAGTPTLLSGTLGATSPGFSGIFSYGVGYLTQYGFRSPVTFGATNSTTGAHIALSGFTTPPGFGITSILFYRTSPSGSDYFQIGSAAAGSATFVDTGLPLSALIAPETVFWTASPQFYEIFQNRLFQGGFTNIPGSSLTSSSVVFSETGQPENILQNNNFEVRTNDGDRVSGLKAYQQSLYIFKERSFHRLTGDSPQTFDLNEISDQYGCISNRAIAIYEDVLLFLDRKGVVEFNGAGTRVVSTPVEPIFLSMNVNAARQNAVAIHNRLRNEVWFGIPIQGSTLNNVTVVYDYYSKAWTTFKGFEPSSLSVIRGALDAPAAFYGSYNGSVHFTGATLTAHNGQPIVCKAQTQYFNLLGQSITTQWRRLYTNTNVVPGGTMGVVFYNDADGSQTIAHTAIISLDNFQSREEFGIPAKNLSIEYTFTSATFALTVEGLTIEGRMQRKV